MLRRGIKNTNFLQPFHWELTKELYAKKDQQNSHGEVERSKAILVNEVNGNYWWLKPVGK